MRAVVQRVRWARVRVAGEVVGQIGPGLAVLVGVSHADTVAEARKLASKVWHLRIFDDPSLGEEARAMSRPVSEVGGSVMVISQFTLYGDTSRGRRPSWAAAAPAERARPLVDEVVEALTGLGATVATGSFGARMNLELENEGPVTLLVEV